MGKRIDWGTVIVMTFDGVTEQNSTALVALGTLYC